MKPTLDAIKALIPAPYAVDLWVAGDATGMPYVVLWAPSHSLDDEAAIAAGSAFTAPLRLTVVAGTLEGVQIILDRLRPLLDGQTVTVAGRHVVLTWVRSEALDLDQTVTIPTTNRHPAYGVETYTIHSQPA